MSNSRLVLFSEDPEEYAAIFVHRTRTQRPATPSMQFGTDVERWLFHGQLPGVALLPDELATAEGRKSAAYREWKMANVGRKLMSLDQALRDPKLAHFGEIANNVAEHALADNLLYESGASIHDVIHWTDPETRVPRCCQLDVFKAGDFIADMKTSRSVDPGEWDREVYEWKYHWQAATYIDAVYELTGCELPFYWIVIKNQPGYGVEVFQASAEQIDLGRFEYRRELRRWVKARDAGMWRSATFSMATQSRLPYFVAQRGVTLLHKGQNFTVR